MPGRGWRWTLKVDSEREREWWDAKAPKEEKDLSDEAVNRALRWREIERHLEGVQTILSVGGGTGVFSIPLARRGFSVTHLDFAPGMLEIARRNAEGVDGIRFVEANAADLSQFADRSSDLVLNMDGAISFSGSEAEKAVLESCRATRKKLIVTVTNRALMIPIFCSVGLHLTGQFMDGLFAMWENGEWHQEQFPDNPVLSAGMTQDYCGALKAFLPAELRRILEGAGMRVLRCGGLGSLALLCGAETVEQVLKDDELFRRFVDLCDRFDREILPGGPGTRQRAGLIAVAEPGEE
jgi:ubiquinone/menaquinone biosynthesis C-methylase UbiE